MADSTEARRRTRAFARVIGPFLAITCGIVAVRAPDMRALLAAFFANTALVWLAGGLLLLCGLIIIAGHQYWQGGPAIIISLLGWFLALRGVLLLVAPQWIASGGASLVDRTFAIRAAFGLLALIGLRLAWVGWAPEREPG